MNGCGACHNLSCAARRPAFGDGWSIGDVVTKSSFSQHQHGLPIHATAAAVEKCLILCRGRKHTAINRQNITQTHPFSSSRRLRFIPPTDHLGGKKEAMAHNPTALINISGIPRGPISYERLHDPVILDYVCKGTLSRRSFLTWSQHQDVASTGTNGGGSRVAIGIPSPQNND
jgi:hypothetical protein